MISDPAQAAGQVATARMRRYTAGVNTGPFPRGKAASKKLHVQAAFHSEACTCCCCIYVYTVPGTSQYVSRKKHITVLVNATAAVCGK